MHLENSAETSINLMVVYRDRIGANACLNVVFCLNSEICWISTHLFCDVTSALETDLQQEK